MRQSARRVCDRPAANVTGLARFVVSQRVSAGVPEAQLQRDRLRWGRQPFPNLLPTDSRCRAVLADLY